MHGSSNPQVPPYCIFDFLLHYQKQVVVELTLSTTSSSYTIANCLYVRAFCQFYVPHVPTGPHTYSILELEKYCEISRPRNRYIDIICDSI